MESYYKKLNGVKNQAFIILIVIGLLLTASYAHGSPEARHGDINDDGRVDVQDVVLVVKHVLNIEQLDTDQQILADVNDDGVINVKDVSLITQYWLGLVDRLPVIDDSSFEDKDETKDDEKADKTPSDYVYDDNKESPADYVYDNDEKSPADHVYNSQ